MSIQKLIPKINVRKCQNVCLNIFISTDVYIASNRNTPKHHLITQNASKIQNYITILNIFQHKDRFPKRHLNNS